MSAREQAVVPLVRGERLILYEQGGYNSGRSWQLGHLYLTDKRLLFHQATRTVLNVPLQSIVGIDVEKRPFFLRTKDCLRLFYWHKAIGRTVNAIIVVAHLETWIEWIAAVLLEQGIDLGVQVDELIERAQTGTRHDPGYRGWDRLGRGGLENITTSLQLRREEILAERMDRINQGSEDLIEEVLAEFGVEADALDARELEAVMEILDRDVAELDAADGLPTWGLAQARRERALERAGEKPPRMGAAEAQRRRLQEIAMEVGDLAAARRDRALDRVPAGKAADIPRAKRTIPPPGQDHVQLKDLLAELEAEEQAAGEAGAEGEREGDLVQARRDRAQGRMPGGKAEEAWRQEIAHERLARAQKGRVPAIKVNLDGPVARAREERTHGMVPGGKSEEGWRQELAHERLARAQKGRVPVIEIDEDSPRAQARRDRGQGKVPPRSENKEVVKMRIEQARRRAMEGIYDLDRAEPPSLERSDIAQARRERVQEILAEIHADYPDRIGEEEVDKVAQALDPASAAVLKYLWENRYAKIEELRELIGETSHMNVLLRIRETINPAARKMLGKPLLVFERSRIDEETGRNITYSWWLSREVERRPVEPGGLVDIFDEDDHLMVIMEFADVEEADIQVRVEGQRLVVRAGDRLPIQVPLPARVEGARVTTHYQNNILQVQLRKVT
ncbi:MAG: Hsp20/alpha crystallin family protein [Anaerolineae bacterium]